MARWGGAPADRQRRRATVVIPPVLSPRSLQGLAWLTGAAFIVSALAYLLTARAAHGTARGLADLVCAAALFILAATTLRRPTRRLKEWDLPLLAAVPLLNNLYDLGVSGDPDQAVMLMVVLIACGATVTSARTLRVLCASTLLGWALVALRLDTDVLLLVRQGVQLAFVSTFAVLLHRVRSRRQEALLAAEEALGGSERRFRSLYALSPVGIGVSDEQGRIINANPALCALLGCTEAELRSSGTASFAHPDDQPGHLAATAALRDAPDGIAQLERRFLRADGSLRWAWLSISHIPGPEGQNWRLAHVQDITDRKNAELALRGAEADLAAIGLVARRIRTGEDARESIVTSARQIVDATYVGIAEPSGADELVLTAAAGSDAVGMPIPLDSGLATARTFLTGEQLFVADPAGHPLVNQVFHQVDGGLRSMLWQPVVAHGAVTAVLIFTWAERVEAIDPRRARAIALLADETAVALEHERVLIELQQRAYTDALTGLANRRVWDAELGRLIALARRSGRPLTVALVDLDRFKLYNDAHGHQAGDELLQEFAQRAVGALRDVDVLARWGGEEFAIALPDCPLDQAEHVLERLRGVVPDGQTASAGYASWDGKETAEQLLQRVDAALYTAKEAGRDRSRASGDGLRLRSPHTREGDVRVGETQH